MPNLFAITTPSDSTKVELNDKRQGQAAFTVSNISENPLRGRGVVVAQEPAVSWLKIDGEAERNFAVGGTEQYVVRVAVPPDAKEGSYTFRLDMADEKNPDDNASTGPHMTFQVPKPLPRKFPRWIVAVGALVVVIAIVLIVILTRQVVVPKLAGMAVPTAKSELEKSGLQAGGTTPEASGQFARDLVIRSDPQAGAKVARGSAVDLIMSIGVTPTPTPTPTPAPAVTSVTATADPTFYDGMCPKTFLFSAVITINRAGTVTYMWEGSDGISSAPQSLTFGRASSQKVEMSLRLSKNYEGWQRVRILTPNELVSNTAGFHLNCSGISTYP